jgi:single-stranded DNA-binding protein
MSGLWATAVGVLARDAERRTGAKAEFATGTIRVGSGDTTQWVSIIAFACAADRLLGLHQGDVVSVAGRLEMRTWRGQDGADRAGLSIVASEITAARKPKPRARDGAPQDQRSAYRASRQFDGGGAEAPLDEPLPELMR